MRIHGLGICHLTEKFPRLYNILNSKNAISLCKVGYWENNIWNWSFQWRKGISEWEFVLWGIMIQVIQLKFGMEDK